MLLQTNSYVVPQDKRSAHARLLGQFTQTLARLGCDLFEVYEQVGSNWDIRQSGGRFVQIMRFRDREHQLSVQAAERNDADAQALISRFCELINFPYQQEHGYFAVGFYTSLDPAEGDVILEADAAAGFAPVMRLASDDDDAGNDRQRSGGPRAPGGRAVVTRRHPDDVFGEELVADSHASGDEDARKASSKINSGAELEHLLDGTFRQDDLDVAMPAELLDEEDSGRGG